MNNILIGTDISNSSGSGIAAGLMIEVITTLVAMLSWAKRVSLHCR